MCCYHNNPGGISFPLLLPGNMVGDEFVCCPRVKHVFGQQQSKTVTTDYNVYGFRKVSLQIEVYK